MILSMLMLKDTFPYCPLTIKSDKSGPSLVSYQETESKHIFRYARFFKDYFKSLKAGDKEETIHINAQKIHKVVSREEPEAVIRMYTDGDEKLMLSTPRADVTLHLLEATVGTCTGLPFSINKDGLVEFKTAGPLENIISITPKDLKRIVSYSSDLDTDKYQFILSDKKEVTIKVGDLEIGAEKAIYQPIYTVKKYVSPVNSTISLAMKEMSETFTCDIDVQCKTGMPMFFSEKSHKHRYGVLVAPYVEPEEGQG